MSNILIIKHGSLGDIVQISGVLRDIRENHIDKKIFLLTTTPYIELMSKCPHLDAVLLDKRLPRWNVLYLIKLKKFLRKYNFSHVFDLQNSTRTSFYRKFLLNYIANWSSTETILKENEKKEDFDNEAVLERFKIQLESSNIKTKHTLKPDFSWAKVNVKKILNKYFSGNFILLFPFCSPQLPHKKWLHFNELIKIIKSKHPNVNFVVAPGPSELDEANKINSISISNLNIMELAGLITEASYIIANDTGPAHMSAHLGQKGIVLFGYHTTPKKVSIETVNFKAIVTDNLNTLSAEKVFSQVEKELKLIN